MVQCAVFGSMDSPPLTLIALAFPLLTHSGFRLLRLGFTGQDFPTEISEVSNEVQLILKGNTHALCLWY